jgi:ankyrin repeat protein
MKIFSQKFPPDRIARRTVEKLRSNRITGVNDLLTTLGPRYTSWPRDLAIISGLLVGVEIPSSPSQQGIYQSILKKLGTVYHGHLFHNLPTMSKGFTWCPTSLLDLPLVSTGTALHIGENGTVVGTWKVFDLDGIPKENFILKSTHPFIEARLLFALTDKDKHVLLVEPDAEPITRALLVKVMKNTEKAQLVGSVYFHASQKFENKSWIKVEIGIGDTGGTEEIEGEAWSEVKKATDQPNYLGKVANVGGGEGKADFHNESGDDKEALPLAAADGDEEKVKRLLQNGAIPTNSVVDKWTVLHHMTWRGYYGIVKELIEKGADKTFRDELGQQALHLAAERGNPDTVGLLINGVDLNVRCNDKQTVLHRAAWGGSDVVVELLLKEGYPTCNLNALVKDGKTALHIAAEKGHTSVVRLLLGHKASINAKDNDGRTALYWAVSGRHDAVVELLLLIEDVNVNLGRNDGATPLAAAFEHSAEHNVKLLLEKGAKVNYSYSVSPVGEEEALLRLLERAKRLVKEAEEYTSGKTYKQRLYDDHDDQAKVKLKEEEVEKVIEKLEKLSQVSDAKRTPLWRAEEIRDKLLLAEKDVDVNLKDESGLTPWMEAVRRRHDAVVNLLRSAIAIQQSESTN